MGSTCSHSENCKNYVPTTWTCLDTLWYWQISLPVLHWWANQSAFLVMTSFELVIALSCTHSKQRQSRWELLPLPREGVDMISLTTNTPPPQDRKDLITIQRNESLLWIKLLCCSTLIRRHFTSRSDLGSSTFKIYWWAASKICRRASIHQQN